MTSADGHAERIAALAMIEPRADRPEAISAGADKAYDAENFVDELRWMNVRAHVAQNTSGRNETVSRQRKTCLRGCDRVGWSFAFTAATYDPIRPPKRLGALA